MAVVTDFASLKTAIQKWMEKEGEPALLNQLDTIVQMAEAWLSRRLRGYQREVTGTVLLDAEGKAAIPAGTLAVKSIAGNGVPLAFSLSGATLSVEGARSATLDMVSIVRLPALGDANPSNWLMQEAPDAYLYASLAQANIFLEAAQNAALYLSQASEILADLNLTGLAAQYGMASLTPSVQVP